MITRSLKTTKFLAIAEIARLIGRPICLIDLQTTGLLSNALVGIVELAYLRINPNGSQKSGSVLLNPDMRIPEEATKMHGITYTGIAKKKNFLSVIPLLNDLFSECVIAGYNSQRYDLVVIKRNAERYQRTMAMPSHQLDVRSIHIARTKSTRGTLINVALAYNVLPGSARRAMTHVITTAALLEAMLRHHGEAAVLASLVSPVTASEIDASATASLARYSVEARWRALVASVRNFCGY